MVGLSLKTPSTLMKGVLRLVSASIHLYSLLILEFWPANPLGSDLDSLVVGSADPKRKAFLKGPQTRNWTSFIEAITADGRALTPGIIFKGKQLQKQWFLDEFKQIADWYYITSPNGWTDDHIGIEWLERVYLPQTTPADESDARLIILDGHGSHATVCPPFPPSHDHY
jgi:hypothetical protein